MRTDLEYGDIIYRKKNNEYCFYIFIKYVTTFEQSLPQYVVVCIPVFRVKDLKDYKKKLEYINTRYAHHARVKVSAIGWEKTSDNVKGYLVKNQLVNNLHIWYNQDVFLDVKDKSKITDCDEETFYMQYKNQFDYATYQLLGGYWMPKLFNNTLILQIIGIKNEDYKKALQCMKQEKELQFGAVFRRLNVRIGYYNSNTDMVEEGRFNDMINNYFTPYFQYGNKFFKYCKDFYESTTYHKLVKTEYVRLDNIKFKVK